MTQTSKRNGKKASVVGAGQGGLHMAHGLMTQGWDVTLLSDRTAEEMINSNAGASHGVHRRTMDFEREAGIDCYDQMVQHPTTGVDFKLSPDGQEIPLHYQAYFTLPLRAIDSRFKSALQLESFERRGGRVRYGNATLDDVEELADQGPVFMATGKGELGSIFEKDEERTLWDGPQRRVLLLLIDGLEFDVPEKYSLINFTASPGRGEMFYSPNTHYTNRAIHTVLFEAIPGSEVDWIDEVTDAESAIRITKELINAYCPWENEVFANVRMPDPRAFLKGAIPPMVRKPVAKLPSGKQVYGLGDVVVLNDPIAGQGANCTAYGVWHLLNGIKELDGGPITPDWFEATFDDFFETRGQYFIKLTKMFLEPPNDAVGMVMGSAPESPAVAARIVDAFREPWNFLKDVETVEKAQELIAKAKAEDEAAAVAAA